MQNNKSYTEEITNDGSPTLRLNSTESSESMHHSGGAASETIYIYGQALVEARKHYSVENTRYLVLGLGLGYIEILISLMTDFKFLNITSFEKDIQLIKSYVHWFQAFTESLHDKVFESLLLGLNLNVDLMEFKNNLSQCLLDNKIVLKGALKQEAFQVKDCFHVICYDAFSSKTNGLLWSYSFLDHFIKHYCAEFCVFASYAKTGTLSRVLKDNGFELISRSGFAGKRESTLALRIPPKSYR